MHAKPKVCAPYVVAINLFFTELLHELINLVLGGDKVIGEDLLVKSAGIGDNHGHVATDVSQVGQSSRHVAITDNLIVTGCHGVVDTPGGKAGVGKLVPPTDIDDGVRQPQLTDLIVNNFLLCDAVPGSAY